MEILKYRDFVEVISSTLDKEELKKGSVLFVAGTQPVSEDAGDPYNLRVKLIVCPTVDGHIVNTKFFMLDPKSVIKVGTEEQLQLIKVMEEDFKNGQ